MNKEYIEHKLAEDEINILRQAMEALNTIAPLEFAIETIHVLHDQNYDYMLRGKVFRKEFVWCVEVNILPKLESFSF